MSRRVATLWVVTVVLVGASTVISVGRDRVSDIVLYGLLPVSCATVGALVTARRPGNAIGWIFSGLGLYLAVAELGEGYGLLAADEGLPAGHVGTWVISWSWVGEVAAWAMIIVRFPDGRLPGRRWLWVPWLAVMGFLLAVPGVGFGGAANDTFSGGVNPFLVDSPAIGLLQNAGAVLLIASLLGAAVSMVLRLRRASGVERQQLKWFALAAAALAVVAPFTYAFWQSTPIVIVAIALAFNALPVAAGVAILRHRLYDIDLVINRTLVYSALSLALAGTYLGSVLFLQVVLRPLAGKSDLAVAASTLAVAAMFGPLRSRIQDVVDRRFFRQRYDAARTLNGFTGRLRNQLDLETLGTDLRGVVHDTMQPVHSSLWFRSPGSAP